MVAISMNTIVTMEIYPRKLSNGCDIKEDASYPGDVSQVEQVVYLGGCGQEARHHTVVHLDGGLGHDVADRLHLLLEVLQLLVDHAAKDSLDLGFLRHATNTCL